MCRLCIHYYKSKYTVSELRLTYIVNKQKTKRAKENGLHLSQTITSTQDMTTSYIKHKLLQL
ncbi:hypothetical protein NQ314_007002 [Rhamnusium bicolor]|uniref:Uncharacterized protein n=1 Tax=Rhamnusium bicolor TaxID=1586634 RepID=A0AAV8YT47_9CUCU|nr:hypothetical protein NQ314_007002 [Rhamnusium bicolor]